MNDENIDFSELLNSTDSTKKHGWSHNDISKFLNGVKTGKIIPTSFSHNLKDKKGRPFSSFRFPESGCEIHVHWNNDNRDVIAKAHIKDPKINNPEKPEEGRIAIVDGHTIAMMRHFSGLDDKDKKKQNIHKNKKGTTSISRILIFSAIAIFLLIIIIIKSNKNNTKHEAKSSSVENSSQTKIEEYALYKLYPYETSKSRKKLTSWYSNRYNELGRACMALHSTHEEISPYGFCNFNYKKVSANLKNSRNHLVTLKKGQRVIILEVLEKEYQHEFRTITNKYYKKRTYKVAYVETENGQKGWIHGCYLEKLITNG